MNEHKSNRRLDSLSDQIHQIADALRLAGQDAADELRRSAQKIEDEVDRFCNQAQGLGDMLNEGFDLAETFSGKIESMFGKVQPMRSHTAVRSGLADAAAESSETVKT
jgi:uncharacterized protein YukE